MNFVGKMTVVGNVNCIQEINIIHEINYLNCLEQLTKFASARFAGVEKQIAVPRSWQGTEKKN